MELVAYDPFVLEEEAQAEGVTLYDLDELLAAADFVTLHSAVTPESTRIIDADAIAQMKESAVLINVARGRLVDEEALLEGLNSGRLRAAALDVYDHEPPDGKNGLISHPRVLHTPHLGDSTVEAQHAVATQAVTGMLDALRGINYPNALNLPFPAGLDYSHLRPYMLLAQKLGQLQAHMASEPIIHVDVDVRGETVGGLLRPIATALLKGMLRVMGEPAVNDVNAPLLAESRGIELGQALRLEVADYPNLISCRARWEGGERIISGVLFGGDQPRVVQVDNYHLDANPSGVVLIMQNRDVPGVIGQIGTILAAYEVNIGEWRMGRYAPGNEALSFINLDSDPPPEVLAALGKVKPVTFVTVVRL
jgi:D-3-phosphoglycerate dehydrogenase